MAAIAEGAAIAESRLVHCAVLQGWQADPQDPTRNRWLTLQPFMADLRRLGPVLDEGALSTRIARWVLDIVPWMAPKTHRGMVAADQAERDRREAMRGKLDTVCKEIAQKLEPRGWERSGPYTWRRELL